MNNIRNFLLCGLITNALVFYSSSSFSALAGDSYWLVEKGDSVYSIARKVFPDDAVKQRQFRNELVKENPGVFNGGAGQLNLGDRLLLPAFAVSKPVPAAEPVIEKAALIPVAAVQETVEEKAVIPDPEEVIGHVVISIGSMQADNRGTFRELIRKSEILKGDTLSTSRASYTQIRMKDGALISLRPNTQLTFTDYNFNGEQDGSERSVMELVRGGFRTITGYIGHRNKKNYRVKTAVATIGIRGTHYALMVCTDGSCAEESASLEDGVYGGVVDGSIVVENESGITTFNNDQYFYVASAELSPVEQLVPPPVFHGKNEKQAARKAAAKQTGGNGRKKALLVAKKLTAQGRVSNKNIRGDRLGSLVQSYVDDKRPPVIFRDQRADVIGRDNPTATTASNGTGLLLAYTGIDNAGALDPISAPVLVLPNNNNQIVLDSKVAPNGKVINNLPIGLHEESGGFIRNLVLPSGVKGIQDIGGNPVGVNWGRWAGKYTFVENGAVQPTVGDLHFVISNNITTPDELSALGGIQAIQTYNLAGGTTPTNASGQFVQLNNLQVRSNFVTQQIDYAISATDNNVQFIMSASGVRFQDMSDIALINSNCTGACTGNASAAFVGNQAEGVITTYSMQKTGGPEGAAGAAVLVR